MTDFALSRPLELGESLTQSEVEDVFETNFGYQFRGITLRAPDQGRYLILLANEGEIYDDDLSGGDTFTYLGEGVQEKGDQKETPANKALIDAIHDPLPIYLFTSTEGVDDYDYRGIVSVEDYAYVSDGQRMVYKFQIKRLEIPSWERYQHIDANIDQRLQQQPTLIEETTEYTATESSIRSAVFRRKVRAQYNYSCAICGARRFSPDGNPEVEAAHIYPKSEDGADDPRNGLALCRFHHWAFDSGWISIANDHTLLVKHNADRNPPTELTALAGEPLQEPTTTATPHPVFLRAHRRLHAFEQA